jgi:hypothetical protein
MSPMLELLKSKQDSLLSMAEKVKLKFGLLVSRLKVYYYKDAMPTDCPTLFPSLSLLYYAALDLYAAWSCTNCLMLSRQ